MKKLLALSLSLSLILSPMAFAGEAKTKGYADQILGIANGLVGATIITSCTTAFFSPSMMAYMAGSTVYIAAEIMGGELLSSKKKKSDKKLSEIQANAQGGDYQKAAIDAQIEDEKDTLDHIKKRRKWIMAVKVSYAAATGLAIYEAYDPFGEVKSPSCIRGQGMVANQALAKGIATAYAAASGYSGGGMMGAAAAGGAAGAAYYTELLSGISGATAALDSAIEAFNSPKYRVAFFGAATGLALMIDSNLASEEEKSKKKISDLERARGQFYQNTATTTTVAEGSVATDINLAGTTNSAVKALPTASTTIKSCYSRKDGVTTYSAEGCASPLSISRTNFSSNMDLPSLVSAANTATDMANSVSSGNLAGADVAAGNLAGMAARIDAVNKSLLTKLNDKLTAKGEKPVDMNPTDSQKAAAASIGAGGGSGSSSGAAQMATLAPATNTTEKSETASSQKTQAISTADNKTEAVRLTETGIGSGLTETELFANQAAAEKQLNELDIVGNNNDISKAKEASIFKQVSNRYILNYNKIFDKKQLPSEPAQ